MNEEKMIDRSLLDFISIRKINAVRNKHEFVLTRKYVSCSTVLVSDLGIDINYC